MTWDTFTPHIGRGIQNIGVYAPSEAPIRWMEIVKGSERIKTLIVKDHKFRTASIFHTPLPRYIPITPSQQGPLRIDAEVVSGSGQFHLRFWDVDPVE